MAIGARYTSQRPYVGTESEGDLVDGIAERLGVSKAAVMRYALNVTFGLTTGVNDGEVPRGKTLKALINDGVTTMASDGQPADEEALI